MRAGGLDRRMVVQQRSTSKDAVGGQLTTWPDVVTIDARIRALSGRELELAKTIATEITHEIATRYQPIFADPKVSAAYRLTYNGRIFNIHDAQNTDERDREIVFKASEGLNDG